MAFIGSLVDQLVTPMDPIPTNKKKAFVDHNRFLEVHKPVYRADKYMNDENENAVEEHVKYVAIM